MVAASPSNARLLGEPTAGGELPPASTIMAVASTGANRYLERLCSATAAGEAAESPAATRGEAGWPGMSFFICREN